MADKTESPVKIYNRDETVVGQPQARPSEPHDGATVIREVVVHTDEKILDPNSELAVQVPEGVGASTVGESPILSALNDGTAEEQFANEQNDNKKSSSKK